MTSGIWCVCSCSQCGPLNAHDCGRPACLGPTVTGGGGAGGGGGYSPGLSGPGSPGGTVTGGGGYAPGGVISSLGASFAPLSSFARPAARKFPAPGQGMTGFAGAGELDFEPEFTMKPVRGLRQWTLKMPDLRNDPHQADSERGGWSREPLTGVTGWAWPDGMTEALCGNGHDHIPPVEALPDGKRDGCGFWAYWSLAELAGHGSSGSQGRPVLGIIEGYGRVLLGERGFRSQRAKIIALAPAFTVRSEVTLLSPEIYGEKQRDRTEEARQRGQQHADAWMAVIQDRLGQLYPSARVFATTGGMLASVPPDGRPE